MILNEHNEVLVNRRLENNITGGKWQFPGGILEFRETFEECGAREAEEETGLKLDHK